MLSLERQSAAKNGTSTLPQTTEANEDASDQRLLEAIEQTAHLLPAQGPITVFIHHNTLHAFEDLPFDWAVSEGGLVFGCQPYLSEQRYRAELEKGRIRFSELKAVLREDLGERAAADVLPRFATRLDVRLGLLQIPLPGGSPAELDWYLAETDALHRVCTEASAAGKARLIAETRRWVMRDLRGARQNRPEWAPALLAKFGEANIESWSAATWEAFTVQALWHICLDGVRAAATSPTPPPTPVRHRDLLLSLTGIDSDDVVHELLIRFVASFLDQGLASWQLPDRDKGFFQSFCSLYRRPGGPPAAWMRGLSAELARLQDNGVTALQSVRESLDALGVPPGEWEEFLSASFLALRGWAGMVMQLEVRGDRVAHPVPKGSVIEFLAVRLLLARFSIAHAARTSIGFTGPLNQLRNELRRRLPPFNPPGPETQAFAIFRLAQTQAWSPDEMARLGAAEWAALVGEIEAFTEVERRRIFHLAYEHRFRTRSLDAVISQAARSDLTPTAPRFQVVCCLDDREESLRRHIEEICPEIETFGLAGFYGVAMYYRGAADAHYVPLCPIIVTPGHWVEEEVGDAQKANALRRSRARQALGRASHGFHLGSRSFALGALLSAGLGPLATVPLVARILFPRLAARAGALFRGFVRTPPKTDLSLLRCEEPPRPANGGRGYSLDEMANVCARQLSDMGLTKRFSRLVFLLGHGSSSVNNPHLSAYDCGACGGSPGGPNARAFARMLNDPRVREKLVARGLKIPDTTVFVGGYHNTCDDSVTLSDLDRIPATHLAELEEGSRIINEACDRNAHERCRRFMSAPLDLSFAAAKQHVEGRSEDLAQTRPELGHATNALCIVARRGRTRGLFFDRRAFLTSYDPTLDDAEATILTRILQAAVPVCGGINLEYYFSQVDPAGYGCSTKLPHNVASLIGVMDGAASDLRTGLPWQMVEIHEPVRLLFIIEAFPETMTRIMEKHEGIGKLIRNGWVQLACLDPTSEKMWLYKGGHFRDYQPQATQLPTVPTSADWYRGWRDHLEFARIGSEG